MYDRGVEHVRDPSRRVQSQHGQDERADERTEDEVFRTEEEATEVQRVEAKIDQRALTSAGEQESKEILRWWIQYGDTYATKFFRRELCLHISRSNENTIVHFAEFLHIPFHPPTFSKIE